MNKPFRFSYENMGDPIECAAHMLKPCIHKYFEERRVDDSVGKREKQMYVIAFAHALERELLDYLDKLEEFNS